MKSCFECNNFGLCDTNNYTCPDWVEYNKKTRPTYNIKEFTTNWLRLHKRWYRNHNKLYQISRENWISESR